MPVKLIRFKFPWNIAFSLMLAACQFAVAEVYKWTDENGKVHFSDKKRDDVRQSKVKIDIQKSSWKRFDIDILSFDTQLTMTETLRIERDVNNVYDFFDRILFFDIHKTVPVKIRLYPNSKAYYKYLSSVIKGKVTPSRGVYLPWSNEIVVYIQKNRESTFRTIKHETAHAIVDTVTPFVPAWLNEGLAEQMETLVREDGRFIVKQHDENRLLVKAQNKQTGLLHLGEFLSLQSAKWRDHYSNAGISLQAQTGELVYFLLSTAPDRSFIIRIIHRYERGEKTLSYHLLNKDYIGGIKVLQNKWNRWVEESDVPYIAF